MEPRSSEFLGSESEKRGNFHLPRGICQFFLGCFFGELPTPICSWDFGLIDLFIQVFLQDVLVKKVDSGASWWRKFNDKKL